jgi:hypothetical protein
MRRILLIVAMLVIAVPAMAAVTVRATHKPTSALCSGVEVNYVCTGGDRMRAFALEVSVDTNFVIYAIRDFNTGENTDVTAHRKGYGIFPGKFRDKINPLDPCWGDGNENSVYNPVAPATDADANGTGIGTKKIIVELGSLYPNEGNAPLSTGLLFRIDVKPSQLGPNECNVTLAENMTRGGVVDINGDHKTPTLTPGKVTYAKKFPCWKPFNFQYTDWLSVQEPNCWLGSVAPDQKWKNQCYGDTDGKVEGTTTKYRIFNSDYAKMMNLWALKFTQIIFEVNNICADADHRYEGTSTKYRVFNSDYNTLMFYWALKDTQLKQYGPCPRGVPYQ